MSQFNFIALIIFTGSLALCRAGLAEATTLKERTTVMTNLMFFMATGYSTGAGKVLIFKSLLASTVQCEILTAV